MHRNNHIKNLSDNSQQCLFKNILKSIRLQSVFIIKKNEGNKNHIVSGEKIRNSGNRIYDYAHLFFGDEH